MKFRLVRELADDGLPVAVACRLMAVSTSGFYEWRDRPPSLRQRADAELTATITEIHTWSRRSYGSPQIHQELRQGRGIRCGRKRVERLMRDACLQGSYRRKGRRTKPLPSTHDDLVARRFRVEAPNKLWVTDITEHPTLEGKVGEINWSSQHLERGGVRWQRCGSGSEPPSSIEDRFRRRVVRKWHGARIGSRSGRRSHAA